MERIEKLLLLINDSGKDSFLQHALALEYIKIGEENKARELFVEILEREPDYIGSYYHLAKLLERQSDREGAISVYLKGMDAAKRVGDRHSLNELQGALEELES